MPVWPTNLPQCPLMDGFTQELPRLSITTEMDAGPAKVRRRFTAGVTKYTLSFILTSTQLSDFQNFFLNETFGGSVPFDMPDPIGGATVQMRFDVAQGSPQVTGAAGRFKVMFKAEKLP